jgi:hypothetical protein
MLIRTLITFFNWLDLKLQRAARQASDAAAISLGIDPHTRNDDDCQ